MPFEQKEAQGLLSEFYGIWFRNDSVELSETIMTYVTSIL